MTQFRNGSIAVLAATLALGACDVREDATTDAAATTDQTAGVTRTETVTPVEEAPVTPMAPIAVIQSQPGPGGAQVDLLKVAVVGDVLTVTLRCSSDQPINSESFDVSKVSVIDDATSQRLGVLKDNDGAWLASNVSGDRISTDCETKPSVIWAKFPAPSATSKTVSISFPEIGPFDGVPVAR